GVRLLLGLDVLAEHDGDAVDTAHAALADSVRLVGWRRRDRGATTDDFSVVGVNIPDPLEQVDTMWTAVVFHEVNRGIVAPHDCVGFVAEIPRKPQHIAIERGRGRDIRDMQYWRALKKLRRIRRRERGHRPASPSTHPMRVDTTQDSVSDSRECSGSRSPSWRWHPSYRRGQCSPARGRRR